MKNYKLIEIIGMSLILIAFGFEIIVDSTHNNIINSATEKHIIKRLDDIHQRQYYLQKNLNDIAIQIKEERLIGSNHVPKYKYNTNYNNITSEQLTRYENWKNFRLIIFAIGSVLLIYSKIREYLSKNV